jgi:DNA-binding response OmpR family regulator
MSETYASRLSVAETAREKTQIGEDADREIAEKDETNIRLAGRVAELYELCTEHEQRVAKLEELLNKAAATLARATDPETLDTQMDDETQQEILDAIHSKGRDEWLK